MSLDRKTFLRRLGAGAIGLAQFVNGAKGDGIADDTAALLAATQSALAAGQAIGSIELGSGTGFRQGIEIVEIPAVNQLVAVPLAARAAITHPAGGLAVLWVDVAHESFRSGAEGGEPHDREQQCADAAALVVGVLALQGDVREHLHALAEAEAELAKERARLAQLRKDVQFVIDHAGKEMETECGIIRCSELWMAEQLGFALDVTEPTP